MPENITFCFYEILHNDQLIHLSFDQKKHERALFFVKKYFPAHDLKVVVKNFNEKNLKKILSTNHEPLSPPWNNPFFKKGTALQHRVWELITTISYGETKSYGDLAGTLGNRSLARAVGQACNANPLALIIPCHRVTAKNGLGGFAGGNAIKRRLLDLESTY